MVAVNIPLNVPPLAIAAVTTTGLSTALFHTSRTWMTGCCANATPLCADADGWVEITSWLAAGGVTVIGVEVAAERPVAANVSVYWPLPVILRLVNVAAPLPFVVAVFH